MLASCFLALVPTGFTYSSHSSRDLAPTIGLYDWASLALTTLLLFAALLRWIACCDTRYGDLVTESDVDSSCEWLNPAIHLVDSFWFFVLRVGIVFQTPLYPSSVIVFIPLFHSRAFSG
jgi:hypothetical protein